MPGHSDGLSTLKGVPSDLSTLNTAALCVGSGRGRTARSRWSVGEVCDWLHSWLPGWLARCCSRQSKTHPLDSTHFSTANLLAMMSTMLGKQGSSPA